MNTYLETGIAVIMIIVTFSIVAYVIQELIAANFRFRAKMLKRSISLLLGGAGTPFAKAFFDHPQIKLLQKQNGTTTDPSYIPSSNFALAIIDLKNTGIMPNINLAQLFTSWAFIAGTDTAMKAEIEKWYDEYMDRVGGWYKREYRWITRLIAIGIALGFNLNLINIVKTVHHDSTLKAALVAAAEKMTAQPDALTKYYTQKIDNDIKAVEDSFDIKIKSAPADSAALVKKRETVKDTLLINYNKKQSQAVRGLIDSLPTGKLIFGWKHWPWEEQETNAEKPPFIGWCNLALLLLGLFLGAVAVSMGAPFWFALLVKLVNIRRAGIKPPVVK